VVTGKTALLPLTRARHIKLSANSIAAQVLKPLLCLFSD
jgi:hypothetical protein